MTLAEARKKSGLTQKDVADVLGISDSAVCQWETGQTFPRIHHLKKLAKLYRVDISDIISE